jgi:hypothetical protein
MPADFSPATSPRSLLRIVVSKGAKPAASMRNAPLPPIAYWY